MPRPARLPRRAGAYDEPMPVIDLNADLAEGDAIRRVGDDAAMLEVVTTANIACGGHAGDPTTMRRACAEAVRRGVAITAHVAYPDRDGFGRRFLDIAPEELTDQVIAQMGALIAIAAVEGARVAGVKPHGALYNAIAHHAAQAEAVVAALTQLNAALTHPRAGDDDRLALVAAPGTVVVGHARAAGLRVLLEGFADRAYLPDGTLMPRREPGAVLTDPAAVRAQALQIATTRQVTAVDGTLIDLPVDTLCLHGDTPGAVALAREVRAALEARGIAVRPALTPASAGPATRSTPAASGHAQATHDGDR